MATKLGRKSAEDLGPIIPGAERRPPPPDDLDPAEQAHWVAITRALPADWFATGSAPLLKQLCRHIHSADLLAADISRLRAEPEVDTKVLYCTLRMHASESDHIVSLSTKLKLTQKSRYGRNDAAYAGAKGAASSPDPWTDWGSGRQ